MSRRIVIVGGVAAGMSAASQARKHDPGASVVVLERGDDVSYGSCGMPYYLSGVIKDWRALVHYTAERFSEERGVSVLVGHDVTDIDLDRGAVTARHARDDAVFEYDSLVLATGARSIVPPLEGAGLQRVFTLRTLDDGRVLKAYLDREKPARCVIVGGGLLGLELAETFSTLGIAVTVIEKQDHLVSNVEPAIAANLADELISNGVAVWTGESVEAFEGDQAVSRVAVQGGTIDTDFVVLAVGVRPNSELAEAAGIETGAAGAVAIDETGRTSAESVWSAGDCADVTFVPTGERMYLPAGNTSNKQGRVAGANAAGAKVVFPGVVGTQVGKVFGLQVARTGLSVRQAAERGIEAVPSTIVAYSRAGYYPGGAEMTITVVGERRTGRLLGAQMVGAEGCAKRIDVFAAALHSAMSLQEVAEMDLSYSPPYAPVFDPVIIAAREAAKKAMA